MGILVRLPLPLTPRQAAARSRELERLRREISGGAYRVPAEAVAEAIINHVRAFRRRREE